MQDEACVGHLPAPRPAAFSPSRFPEAEKKRSGCRSPSKQAKNEALPPKRGAGREPQVGVLVGGQVEMNRAPPQTGTRGHLGEVTWGNAATS